MRVLVVGSGGREHALAWRLAQSPSVGELFAAPGNSGTAGLGTNLPLSETDLDGIVAASIHHSIDLVVVGPETPLALGLSNRLDAAGIPAFGPSRAAAQLESSKSFARSVMDAAGVPGPNYRVFQNVAGALAYVQYHDAPVVVKADGLAAGKGVAMCANREDAQYAIRACMEERAFGDAGENVVIEDWLHGPEVSVFGFTDGDNLSPVVAATDYKRIGEGGAGANTGGM
ncbi:MAG: ATP-grasp domain-containing protein, partial [Chloroflexi bacterium]|nr:ATP-grasp domain-containing protein [Chloroflexota bacterium]